MEVQKKKKHPVMIGAAALCVVAGILGIRHARAGREAR